MKKRLMATILFVVLLIGSCMTVYAAPEQMSDGTMFDAEYYAQANPDVVAALGTSTAALYNHYKNFGKAEGRAATADGAGAAATTGGFDAAFYAATYPDVVAALGNDPAVLLMHYQNFGKAEGRLPNASGTPVGTGTATPATPTTPAAVPGAGTPAPVALTAPYAVLVNASTIQLADHFAKLPASDDKVLYVYELAVYEYAIPADRTPIASVALSADPVVTFDYNGARLYEKFVYATKQGGKTVMVGTPQFISNPELLATKNVSRPAPVKGVQGPTHTSDLQNVILGSSINVNYLAKTVVITNENRNPVETHPLARGGYAGDPHPVDQQFNKFMFNANDAAGVAALTQDAIKLASGSADVFVIGNEVNVRKWNYIPWTNVVSWDYYVTQYAQAFRVMYNAIKSTNAGAQVLICIDQCWDRNRAADKYNYIDAKDFVDLFNTKIRQNGNIDWGIALHPHPVPLTRADFWKVGGYEKQQVTGNKMVSFENVGVVTTYLTQPQFLKRDGGARYMIVSEMGLTNAQGDQVQAAAVAAAYQAAARNPYISQVIFVNEPQYGGLDYTMIGQAKALFDSIGTPNEAAYMEWAKSYLGISDWGKLLR